MIAAQESRRPIIEDNENLDVRLIEDPNEAQRLGRIGKGPPMRVPVKATPRPHVYALRDDPIAKMAKLGRLGVNPDRDVRLMAARRWQGLYDLVADQSRLDPSADIVDGGRVDDIAEQRATAIKLLGRAAGVLGMRNENLIFNVLGA